MPCFYPLDAFRSVKKNDFGKSWISFKNFYPSTHIQIPCGQCIGCRLEYSRQWAVRGYHESQLYDQNCFITLTYDDDNLPSDGSLCRAHPTNFLKRFRKKISPIKIRYLQCGEYGDQFGRPHYHAIIFGYDFADKIPYDDKLYTSQILDDLWTHGECKIGAVTFDSIAYVARYILKKITGPLAAHHYETFDPDTGEISQRQPEFVTMSRRPGIGKPWLEKYQTDVYPNDYVIINGLKTRPPKYYDLQYEQINPDEYDFIKLDRKLTMEANPITPKSLNAKRVITEQKTSTNLKRGLK